MRHLLRNVRNDLEPIDMAEIMMERMRTLGNAGMWVYTAELGRLTVTAGSGQAAITGAHSKALTLTGELLDVNAALAPLTYGAAAAGSDVIRTLTRQSRGEMRSRVVAQ